MPDHRSTRTRGASARSSSAAPYLLLAGVLALVALAVPRGSPQRSAGPTRVNDGPPPRLVEVAPLPGDSGIVVPRVLRLVDVDATPVGWAVLDGPSGPAVAIDRAGIAGPPLGRAGEGPGEVSAARFVARRDDRVAILDLPGQRLDVLGEGAEPVRFHVRAPGCAASTAEDLAADAGGWLVLRRCLGPGSAIAQVLRVTPEGSVTVLAHERLVEDGITDPFLDPFLVVDGSVWLGTTRSDCLRRVDGPGDPQTCMTPVERLPVPDDVRRQLEGPVAARARAAGVRLFVPDELPALAAVRPAPTGWAVQRWRASGDAAWVLEDATGVPLELVPPAGITIEPGPAGLLLLRQELTGLRAWIVPPPTAADGTEGPP